MTGELPVPNPVLHRVRSSASSFNFQYPLVSFSSSSRHSVFFSVFPSLLSFLISFLQWRILEDSFHVRSDESSFSSFVLSCIGYSFAPWCYVIYIFFFIFHMIGTTDRLWKKHETRPKVRRDSAVAEAVRGLRYVLGCLVRLSAGAHSTDFLHNPWSPQADSVILH